MDWIKERIFKLRYWWRTWHPFKDATSTDSKAILIALIGYQIMVMSAVECLGLTVSNALGLSILSISATAYVGVLGTAIYLFLAVRNKEVYDTIDKYALFLRYALLRIAISFIIGWFLGFSPSTLLPKKAGVYIGLTDKHFESEGGGYSGESRTTYTVGDLAIVIRRDITDAGIDEINEMIGTNDEYDYQLRRSKEGRFAYVGQYDFSALPATYFLFWQTAVSKGYIRLPEGSHHDQNDLLGIFKVAPFVVLEFLIKELPYAILLGLFLWMFRAGIAPKKFAELQQLQIYHDEEE